MGYIGKIQKWKIGKSGKKGNVGEMGIKGIIGQLGNEGNIRISEVLGKYTRQVKLEYFFNIVKIRNFSESSENREYIENRVYRKK